MLFKNGNFTRMPAVAALVMAATLAVVQSSAAREDDDEDRGRWPAVINEKWVSECGACHVAYPARYLPAESWRAIMSGLDKHFGSNASLDAADIKEITAFLERNADTGKKSQPASGKPVLRITETRWFKSEHREVAQHTWKNAKVRSRANCGACHTRAESGDFSERNVKIPR
jgi:mono/diheme cytochrome c family protein